MWQYYDLWKNKDYPIQYFDFLIADRLVWLEEFISLLVIFDNIKEINPLLFFDAVDK